MKVFQRPSKLNDWNIRVAMHLAPFKNCFSKISFGFHGALKFIGIWNGLTRVGINSSKLIVLPVEQWYKCTKTFLLTGIIIRKFNWITYFIRSLKG